MRINTRRIHHFWYSHEMRKRCERIDYWMDKRPNNNTVMINGKRFAYTICGTNKRTSKTKDKDIIYLGKAFLFKDTQHHTPNWEKYIPKEAYNATKNQRPN
jgi:hypothetical protein